MMMMMMMLVAHFIHAIKVSQALSHYASPTEVYFFDLCLFYISTTVTFDVFSTEYSYLMEELVENLLLSR